MSSRMASFVDSCVERLEASASAVMKGSRGRHHARALLRRLTGKKNVLVTTHEHPDPDALASVLAICTLLEARLTDARITASIKGRTGGGINTLFAQITNLNLQPWDESALAAYDAIVLLDVQPTFSNSPLPADRAATAVIDHHRSRRRPAGVPFCDVRPDVGATGSIVFSYFMELEQPITPDLGAALLFAIESDLAGAAGQPGELDNVALSSLTLIADTRKLYRMRYAPLPQSYYTAYANAVGNAMVYDDAIVTFLDEIDSPEMPAVMADLLLRYEKAQWALAAAVFQGRLVLSLRTHGAGKSAAEVVRRLVRHVGEGGGHKTKAGGSIPLANGTPGEIERLRGVIRRRYLRALRIPSTRGAKLVPR
jgi:nanoRNase/pAp phosphatase (c-di-AMP/oligoRNAs hydrolase)